ncbi:MAG: hypothetical protein Q7V00_14650 [Sulfurimicrobium sp.]|nr:hypothetical protein [Sulfurimicrobium sp.]MDO9190199.1 hypothetical protein [Sulfurimicrobium sp.]MDP1705635.1 hypothetical protein [Sulfurimicrobium sp.]MDP2198705.1 hypothetical protein [Sulfurimicrobium sp.]MDP3686768.1 hypothetical protein [Sulfurimicrobium sp.]
MLEYYRDLAEQLAAMPGGHAKLREEFFGAVSLPGPIQGFSHTYGEIIDGWMLQGEGALAMVDAGDGDALLMRLGKDGGETIAHFSEELCEAAGEFSIAPLGLALLALAMGGVDDGGRLKKQLPELHKASKGLLLIAVCRLCG